MQPKVRIKLLSAIAGHKFAHAVGDVVEWDAEESARFVERGLAAYADAAPAAGGQAKRVKKVRAGRTAETAALEHQAEAR